MFGQLGQGEAVENPTVPCQLAYPLGGVKLKSLACGWNHTLALTPNGFVFAWGFNASGQLGIGNFADRSTPELIKVLLEHRICSVNAGHSHSAAIDN